MTQFDRDSLPSKADLAARRATVGTIAEELYGGQVFDYARPVDWDNQMRAQGFDPSGLVVWLYPERSVFGMPAPLSQEAYDALQRLNQLAEG